MSLLEIIQSHFSNLKDGKIIAIEDPKAKDSWVIKESNANGVAIEVSNKIEINEKFSKMNFYTKDYTVEGKDIRLLLITSDVNHLRNEFARICRNFVELGPNNETRNMLTTEPLKWWINMKELLGNANRNTQVYSVIAEMLCLNHLLNVSNEVEWYGPLGGSIDIETEDGLFEVKSTVNRYDSIIHVNGQFQLVSNAKQQLIFCRMEKSNHGYSINDVQELLIKKGINIDYIEDRLFLLGIPKGSIARKEKFKVLETSLYTIDKEFPKITPASFKGEVLPKHIIEVSYTVDLSGLQKENLFII
ncbi:PD-(D/E)XK motif protein [Alkalihalobacillus sp. LMS39]|uniref:PD-(D/E)XK motif protein n=1 Tax=Alkalihalobacillus sp. LMS39 TaxID=2924032 RepID=UPI001FB46B6C|nr:PD-(D/E)XK motif protein [Alkalihalobacillus sp. LMS39]UOE95111.1 PD-(D/E)XK motif protein [Alkalihalobacillus sp. LMS39]